MNPWLTSKRDTAPELEILEEAALAMAQAVLQNAITRSGISRAELARRLKRPRSFVSRMLCGDHNLTVKTMARALVACGEEVRFGSEPLNWRLLHRAPPVVVVDAAEVECAGSSEPQRPPVAA